MKYIDAEKLKYEIERRRLQNRYIDTDGYEQELFEIIDSLQQEQPAKQDYKDCNGCEYNRLLKDQIGWQFRGCFGGDYNGKPIAEIELCPLKVSAQQEQPEVDLEKEYKRFINCDSGRSMYDCARHFYELGRLSNK